MKKQYIAWGPDKIPIVPEPFNTREAAEASLAEFPKRFHTQGYYSSVHGRIPLAEIIEHCRIEEVDAEFIWGDEAYDTEEETTKAIEEQIVAQLADGDCGTVSYGDDTYLLQVKVTLVKS